MKKILFLLALLNADIIKAFHSYEEENQFCIEYHKAQEQCLEEYKSKAKEYNKRRQEKGLTPIDIQEDLLSLGGRSKKKRAITINDDEIMEDPKTLWVEPYEKPITYMLINNKESEKAVKNKHVFRSIIIEAFYLWARETDLRFMEVNDPDIAEIRIQFFPGGVQHTQDKACTPFDDYKKEDLVKDSTVNFNKVETMLAHAILPFGGWDDNRNYGDTSGRYQNSSAGDLHFSANLNWDTSPEDHNTYNLFSVAIHEIGHTLGLLHNTHCRDSLMYYRYTDTLRKQTIRTAKLHKADILGIKCLYGERENLWQRREYRIIFSLAGGFLSICTLFQILERYVEFIPHNYEWMTIKRPERGLLYNFRSMMSRRRFSLFTTSYQKHLDFLTVKIATIYEEDEVSIV